jgi:very-short-patch-repair endonuclease
MNKQADRWHTAPALWKKLKTVARGMRTNPTEAENILWHYLRDGKLRKYKFRRQHSLGQYIVDFYCNTAKLVIEVDGPIHKYQAEEDKIKQEYLESHEYKVLRFSNEAVINSIGNVLSQITSFLNSKR